MQSESLRKLQRMVGAAVIKKWEEGMRRRSQPLSKRFAEPPQIQAPHEQNPEELAA